MKRLFSIALVAVLTASFTLAEEIRDFGKAETSTSAVSFNARFANDAVYALYGIEAVGSKGGDGTADAGNIIVKYVDPVTFSTNTVATYNFSAGVITNSVLSALTYVPRGAYLTFTCSTATNLKIRAWGKVYGGK